MTIPIGLLAFALVTGAVLQRRGTERAQNAFVILVAAAMIVTVSYAFVEAANQEAMIDEVKLARWFGHDVPFGEDASRVIARSASLPFGVALALIVGSVCGARRRERSWVVGTLVDAFTEIRDGDRGGAHVHRPRRT